MHFRQNKRGIVQRKYNLTFKKSHENEENEENQETKENEEKIRKESEKWKQIKKVQ